MEYELNRKQIRTLRLTVRPPDGRVVVHAPARMSRALIEDFVRSKETWIREKQREIRERQVYAVPPEEREFWRRELKRRVAVLLPQWEARTGLSANGVTIRDMTSRWGSCNTRTHHITLNLQLARRPDEALSYVILHELAHTRVPDHGPRFRALMDEYMPDWRNIRRSL